MNDKIMKKMIYLLTILVVVFTFIGCQDPDLPVAGFSNVMNGYERINLTMKAGETYAVDINEHFKDTKIDYVKYELVSSSLDVITTDKNILTAVDSGMAHVQIRLYTKTKTITGNKDALFCYFSDFINVFVINEATMTPITTAQELAGINNGLKGHYILKADIDLADWGEWEAIGRPTIPYAYHYDQYFTGMLINPDGYKIKNLTITTCRTESGELKENNLFGLFGDLGHNAFVSGIILEDIFIDVSDYGITDAVGSPKVGGIAASVYGSAAISDCQVSGTIIGGGYSTGGVVGNFLAVFIDNCVFRGVLQLRNSVMAIVSVGGIVGMYQATQSSSIANCVVEADIDGYYAYTGGIIGYAYVYITYGDGIPQNCSVTGTVTSLGRYGTIIGFFTRIANAVD